jgi:hypothetical protein
MVVLEHGSRVNYRQAFKMLLYITLFYGRYKKEVNDMFSLLEKIDIQAERKRRAEAENAKALAAESEFSPQKDAAKTRLRAQRTPRR